MAVEVVRSTYVGWGRPGDFSWMIEQPEHERSLFVFNDNQHQFREHQARLGTPHTCSAGGGNAAIRPYQCMEPPRATGIPTGASGGYPELDDVVRGVIEDAIAHLAMLLATGRYDRVVFSWSEKAQTLGTGIFEVGRDVLDHIVRRIEDTAAQAP